MSRVPPSGHLLTLTAASLTAPSLSDAELAHGRAAESESTFRPTHQPSIEAKAGLKRRRACYAAVFPVGTARPAA